VHSAPAAAPPGPQQTAMRPRLRLTHCTPSAPPYPLQREADVPGDIRVLALRTLTAQLSERTRHSQVRPGGGAMPLGWLGGRSIARRLPMGPRALRGLTPPPALPFPLAGHRIDRVGRTVRAAERAAPQGHQHGRVLRRRRGL
jgi:hypothetical protein